MAATVLGSGTKVVEVAEIFYLVLQPRFSFITQVKALTCLIKVAEPYLMVATVLGCATKVVEVAEIFYSVLQPRFSLIVQLTC